MGGALKFSVFASIAGSLILGVAALAVARFWLPTAKAGETPAAAVVQPVDASLVPVVVAASPLTYGTKLDEGKLVIRRLPPNAVPEGAFSTIEAVLAHDAKGPPVVLMPIADREVVLPAKISGLGSRASVSAQITEGMRAYAVSVAAESGVGGNILPGDWVDVILARESDTERKDRGLVSEVVLQNARVLGLDLNADPSSTETSVPSTATLEVRLEDVQKLAVAGQLGRLSLALRRTGASEFASVRPVRAGEVSRAGSGPAVSARVAPTAAAAPAPVGRPVLIVAGGESSRVLVPVDRRSGR